MTEKVVDHSSTRVVFQENPDSILYTQTKCCDNDPYFGGYRRELFNKCDTTLLSLFKCPHCKHILREPWQLKGNGTQFCNDCFRHLIAFHSKEFQISDAFEDISTKSKLSRVLLTCPFIERGCLWRGPLSSVKDHMRSCGFIKVQCLNEGCKIVRFRSQFSSHENNECLYRLIQCGYCQVKFRAGFREKHVKSECQRSIVICPYKCDSKMERGKIQIHVEKSCPNVTIRCPFYKYGCVTELPRRELGRHMSSPLQHESIFAQRFDAFEKDVEALSIRNDMLLEKIRELEETELGELIIQNRLLHMDVVMLKWQKELFNSISDFENNAKNNFFLWKVQELHDKVRKGEVILSREFTSDQGFDFRLQLQFSPFMDDDRGFINVEVVVANKLQLSKIYFKGDASITILNQNTDHEHYSLQMSINNMESSIVSVHSTTSIGVYTIPYHEFLYKEKYIQNNSLILKFRIGKLMYSPVP